MKSRRLKRVTLLSFLSSLAFAANAEAQQVFDFYTGVRQNAMGNAYTAVVNDETAVIVNPAGLGKVRDTTITIFDPEISAGSETGKVFDSSNYSKALSFNTQNILNEANAKGSYGPIHMKFQLFPSIVFENFGMGIYYKQEHDSLIDSTGANYTVRYVNDFAVPLGYNFRFGGGILKLGVGARIIDRTEIDTTVPVAATNLDLATYGAEGMGISGVAGMILTAPVMWLPAISAVVQDIGTTTFNLSDGLFHQVGNRRPQSVAQKVDAGASLSPILGNHARLTLTGEMHDVTNLSQQLDKVKMIHAGAEVNIADFFFLRGGLNGRYWTAGGEFATARFQLQAASYGQDVGPYPQHIEDRRYVFKFSMRF